ncbi:PfaD family polyunsaturated fatty acid/polyketide biosynthesis protein [Kutzneria sp. CA-103260]|uniref:PfaD family polyunsaturated fatty acid/polyketide biosynthesis protein n=1 Tax=Kutzneria sp. CA-103260 TaxID=2802641 RepID=UPI001BF0317F|nr:PfaD family polyunsaturated fatty acid/polyketide biosynthesis protein [Kutzneria sp. CA-103260]QUQ72492.1 oxidoreductase [Kutzneria sp. CA-103260]
MTATIADTRLPCTEPAGIYRLLNQLDRPLYVVQTPVGPAVTDELPADQAGLLAATGPLPPERLGSAAFRHRHGVRNTYVAGAMAGGIASEDLVTAIAQAGCLGSFGAAGLLPERVEQALRRFARDLPRLPFAVNLIHSPSEAALERDCVDLLLCHRVRCVEASAFLNLTPHLVRYRLAGLRRGADGSVEIENRVIAKVSRPEVAEQFLRPAPEAIVEDLLVAGRITAEQAELARRVPVADDITAEADSGGHTDRRPLTALVPALLSLRDRVQREQGYQQPIGLGVAGGIGTPRALAAAYALGADYVVIGSVHQSCVESGTSPAVRAMLAAAGIADFAMAPAADMFELGVELQVLKKGTLFPMRAKRLLELYRAYDGLEALPSAERERLERQLFRRPTVDIWAEVETYFTRRDPDQLRRAAESPRRKMALVFRWYLGMASRWATTGDPARMADYQVWCGPAMGAFNDWVRGSRLEAVEHRRVADVASELLHGAAFTARVQQLALAGVRLPAAASEYRPASAKLPVRVS